MTTEPLVSKVKPLTNAFGSVGLNMAVASMPLIDIAETGELSV